ncbi:DNA mismatch repair protein MutS [candidate division GN15 bacterium]|nr:DNA mismatch repair protein MutS [candidate division GN15 bacterium]
MSEPFDNDEPIEYPIDGTLDLHQFSPKETRDVVNEYIRECLDRQIYAIRIVHGKGKGVQRRIVQALLDEHPNVSDYRQEGGSGGSWGATVVDLK